MAKIRDNYEKTSAAKAERVLKGTAEPLDFLPEYPKVEKKTEQVEQVVKKSESELTLSPERLAETIEVRSYQKLYTLLSVVVCIILISALTVTAINLPRFGSDSNPANNEVPERYIEKGLEETGAVNIVAGMILDYRAFDTFGESCVLFSAVVCVFILLKGSEGPLSDANDRIYEPKNDMILQTVTKFLFPIILLFGVYIVLNGHISAGGGFSGGAVIGSGLILHLLAFGFKKTSVFMNEKTFKVIVCCSLTFYCFAKSYSFFTGANHLESGIPLGEPGAILSSGLILPLNICVGLIVGCTIYAFYVMFRRGGF